MRKTQKKNGGKPTAEERKREECRRDVPPGIEITERPVLNWERFKGRDEAVAAHKKEGVVFGCGWGEIEWLYMEHIPNEPRISYLRRLSVRGILKSNGYAELKRLEKAAKKKGNCNEFDFNGSTGKGGAK